MNKLKLFFLSFASIFLMIFSASSVFAGGDGVYADTSTTEDPHYNIVRIYFDPNLFTCKGIVVSLNFANPKDGDRISGGNSDNSSTINSDPTSENINGKQYLRCSTYLKVYSPTLELNRTLNISFKGPNLEGSRQIAISPGYGYPYNSSLILPWEENSNNSTPTAVPVSGINVWLLSQQSFYPNGRQATIKWSAFDGNPGTFTIFGKAASNKNNWDKLMEGEKGPSATIKIMTNEDYYIKINGCQDKFGNCVDSNILFIPRIQKDGNITPSQNPSPTISPVPSGDNSKVDELNKKVNDLQNQVDQSKKTQSVLEQRINDLVNFIKKFSPFFK